MERTSRVSVVAVVVAALSWSCGVGPEPRNASDANLDLAPAPEPPPPEPKEEEPPPVLPPGEVVSNTEGEPDARQRDITPRECRALAGKYGELTRSDETAKLSPKLNDKQRAQAAESIDAAARTLETRWAESCESSLVGKTAEEAAITCAMSAKNVAAFDTCLNGPK
jgi:type IV secretory pathway VirB10-like protein